MEIEGLNDIIQSTLSSFDFAFCIVVNVLTYLVITFITSIKKKNLTTWKKRVVLLICISFTGVLYWLIGADLRLLLNSAILAPVFWSWIMKPVCKVLGIDYKNINVID